jgi:hypothetical protein
MKLCLSFLTLIAVAFLTGCVSPAQVATMKGQGKREVFDAPYDVVWRAAVDAAQAGELNVHTADKARGYIGASRGLQMATMGENVGVWVTPVSPEQTEVEVVSRQAGLPALWFKNWENQILNGVAANVTREPGYRGEPAGAERYSPQYPDQNYRDQTPVPAPAKPPYYQTP